MRPRFETLVERSYNKSYAGAIEIYLQPAMSTRSAEKTTAYRRKTAVQRRQELIQAGIACLGKGGLSAFTIDRICREAGVSRGLINHHFKTKEELLLQVYAVMTEHLIVSETVSAGAAQLVEIVHVSFDERSFSRSNLRAWLAIWAEVANHAELNALHRRRYRDYKLRIVTALQAVAAAQGLVLDAESVARQMIALIDGLWLEHCLHSTSFSLVDAQRDCYRFLHANGIDLTAELGPDGGTRSR